MSHDPLEMLSKSVNFFKKINCITDPNYLKSSVYCCSISILNKQFFFTGLSISEGSCDTEDWSNDAENSAMLQE